jgi:hypothetical protein
MVRRALAARATAARGGSDAQRSPRVCGARKRWRRGNNRRGMAPHHAFTRNGVALAAPLAAHNRVGGEMRRRHHGVENSVGWLKAYNVAQASAAASAAKAKSMASAGGAGWR